MPRFSDKGHKLEAAGDTYYAACTSKAAQYKCHLASERSDSY